MRLWTAPAELSKSPPEKEARPGLREPGAPLPKRLPADPADTDIPLVGDAGRLWTTDDASARNYQGFASPAKAARAMTATMRLCTTTPVSRD